MREMYVCKIFVIHFLFILIYVLDVFLKNRQVSLYKTFLKLCIDNSFICFKGLFKVGVAFLVLTVQIMDI